MDVLERLKPLCYTGGDRPNLATPFKTLFEEKSWAVATDGHLLSMFPFEGELRTDGPDIGAVLRPEPAPTHAARLSALREWAGNPYPSERVCGACHGTPPRQKYCPADHEAGRYCGSCDSLGKIVEGIRHGLVLSGGLNRILLARLLCSAPDGVAVVHLGHSGETAPFVLRADGWIAAIMPINGADDKATRFTALTPIASEKVG